MRLWLVWLALSCAALAQTSNAPAAKKTADENASAQYGAITGRVLGEDGPVPFANVSVAPVGGPGRGNAGKSVIADVAGNFKIDGLQALAWRVTANAPGYVTDEVDATAPEAAANQISALAYHRIGDEVMVRLVKGGVITGRVLDAAGEPLVGVRISAQLVRDANGQTANGGGGPNGGDFQTDDRGVYRVYGLPAGAYVVAAGASGGFGAGNRPSPYDGNAPVYYPSSTRDAAVEVIANSGGETNGIDLQYRSEKGYAVSGKVTGAAADGDRLGGLTSVVLAYAASGTVVNRAVVTQRGPGRGQARRQGQAQPSESAFALYGVPVGEYEITAYRNAPNGEDAASASRRFVVSGRDVTGVELALKPLASVAGRLQLERASQCKSVRRAAFEEQVFRLRAEEASKPLPGRPAGPIAAPNRAGELSFRQLNAGRYRLSTELLAEEWFVRSITLPGAAVNSAAKTGAKPAAKPASPALPALLDAGRNGLTLRAGERATGLVVTVAEGAATLAGRIKVAAGPAAGAPLPAPMTVYLLPGEPEQAENVLRHYEIKAGSEGAFKLKNLASGKYWVLARPAEKVAEAALVLKAWNAAERAKLRREAEAANNAIELQPCQRLANYEVTVK